MLSFIKKYGLLKSVLLSTIFSCVLSLIITSISLLIFQGYIDMLGVILAIGVPSFLLPIPAVCCYQALLKLDIAETELAKKNIELGNALEEVKKLGGLLPICASCKKIRDGSGGWNEIEAYIRDNSEAEFSHSICPECTKSLYPDFPIAMQRSRTFQ